MNNNYKTFEEQLLLSLRNRMLDISWPVYKLLEKG